MNVQNVGRVYIGIDPGLTGAVSAIDENYNVLGLVDTPTIKSGGKTLYDVAEMAATLRRFGLMGEPIAILEAVAARPGQGVTSMFSIGRGYGVWQGVLSTLEIPFREVHPATWTRAVLKGAPGTGRERSIAFATKMFPGAELVPLGCRKPRDGRADALCLAYWRIKS